MPAGEEQSKGRHTQPTGRATQLEQGNHLATLNSSFHQSKEPAQGYRPCLRAVSKRTAATAWNSPSKTSTVFSRLGSRYEEKVNCIKGMETSQQVGQETCWREKFVAAALEKRTTPHKSMIMHTPCQSGCRSHRSRHMHRPPRAPCTRPAWAQPPTQNCLTIDKGRIMLPERCIMPFQISLHPLHTHLSQSQLVDSDLLIT